MVIGLFRGTNQRVLAITIVLHKAYERSYTMSCQIRAKTAFKETGSNIVYICNNLAFLRVNKHLGNLKSRVCHSLVHTTAK